MKYIVRLKEQGNCYGPFGDKATADGFAAYLTAEVDPAEVLHVSDPAADLLSFYRQFQANPGGLS